MCCPGESSFFWLPAKTAHNFFKLKVTSEKYLVSITKIPATLQQFTKFNFFKGTTSL